MPDYSKSKIYLVETVCCNTKEELHARERYHIEKTECVNLMIPGRTNNEWYEDNKEIIAQYKKEYYEKNKEKLKQQMKKYQEENKELYAQTSKVYREKNKEKLALHGKEYYEKNKDIISEKLKVKYTCECGSKLVKSSKANHQKTKKHQDFISQSK